jgi:hypothetical protein
LQLQEPVAPSAKLAYLLKVVSGVGQLLQADDDEFPSTPLFFAENIYF